MFQTTQRHLCIGVALLLSSCGGLATFGNRPTDSDKANYKRTCELEETFLKESALDPKIKKTRLFLQRYVDTGIYRQW